MKARDGLVGVSAIGVLRPDGYDAAPLDGGEKLAVSDRAERHAVGEFQAVAASGQAAKGRLFEAPVPSAAEQQYGVGTGRGHGDEIPGLRESHAFVLVGRIRGPQALHVLVVQVDIESAGLPWCRLPRTCGRSGGTHA
ncbi:MAG: hypothetical protein P4L83_18915 [Nevskia sp.]|nr:hypothetical protein [Nevskia sp.]